MDKHLDGSNLTLENFAHVMTLQYPAERRIEIFDKICKSSELAYSTSSRLDALKGIRRKYYEIELQVGILFNLMNRICKESILISQVCAKKNASVYMKRVSSSK